MRLYLLVLSMAVAGCFLDPGYQQRHEERRARKQAERDRVIAIRVAEQRARLARAQYCEANPADCSADRAAQQQAESSAQDRRRRRAAAIGAAMEGWERNNREVARLNSGQASPPPPTYRCRPDYSGGQICEPQ